MQYNRKCICAWKWQHNRRCSRLHQLHIPPANTDSAWITEINTVKYKSLSWQIFR